MAGFRLFVRPRQIDYSPSYTVRGRRVPRDVGPLEWRKRALLTTRESALADAIACFGGLRLISCSAGRFGRC